MSNARVEVVDFQNKGTVVHTILTTAEDAERVELGLLIQLDRTRYGTRVVVDDEASAV